MAPEPFTGFLQQQITALTMYSPFAPLAIKRLQTTSLLAILSLRDDGTFEPHVGQCLYTIRLVRIRQNCDLNLIRRLSMQFLSGSAMLSGRDTTILPRGSCVVPFGYVFVLLKDYNILPSMELRSSPWVDPKKQKTIARPQIQDPPTTLHSHLLVLVGDT